MPLKDPLEEARRVLGQAKESDLTLKLIGGVAVCIRCPSAKRTELARNYVDIDLIGLSKQSSKIRNLFAGMGYIPRDKFNAMYGDRRLIFNDPEHQRRVDVFLDVFEMCHTLNFKDRLNLDSWTVAPADLLASKLQIVEINVKDYKDVIALLLDHDVGSSDDGMINGEYLAKLCGEDWGIWKTLTMNLDKLPEVVKSFQLGPDETVVLERAKRLSKMILGAPKSLRWKMRATVGERATWYRLPEPDKVIVDSRMPGTEPAGQHALTSG